MAFAMTAALVALAGLAQPGPPPFNCTTQPKGTFDPIWLTNGKLNASFIRYGATLTHMLVPDDAGMPRDVVLGWDDRTQYCSNPSHTYFGATIGRVANRITNGSFTLDGKTYHTPLNDKGVDTLHGGWVGYDRRVWDVVKQGPDFVTFGYTSPDGEMGFPGEVKITVKHSLTKDNEWMLEYRATADTDTVLAMTNHAYFNVNANVNNTETVLEHTMTMPDASKFVPVDSHLLPTGEVGEVSTAPWLDFTKGKLIGKDINQGTVTPIGGYDNAWIFDGWQPGKKLKKQAVLYSPLTGISVSMDTDQPSVQFYSGNFLNGTDPATRIQRKASQSFGPDPQYYQWRGAATLEAQHYPDSPNHPNFPTITIGKSVPYEQSTIYKFASKAL